MGNDFCKLACLALTHFCGFAEEETVFVLKIVFRQQKYKGKASKENFF